MLIADIEFCQFFHYELYSPIICSRDTKLESYFQRLSPDLTQKTIAIDCTLYTASSSRLGSKMFDY